MTAEIDGLVFSRGHLGVAGFGGAGTGAGSEMRGGGVPRSGDRPRCESHPVFCSRDH